MITTTTVRQILLGIAVLGCTTAAEAQSLSLASMKWADSVSRLIAAAMAKGQPAAFDVPIAVIDRVLTVTPNDAALMHYKGYALWRKANLLLENEAQQDEIKVLLDEADDLFERSAKSLRWPETYALRASVLGQKIAVGNPMSGMFLGPRADNLMEEAIRVGPDNPRVWMLKGISTMFKPAMFGGGMEDAEKEMLKAAKLFETDAAVSPSPAPTWGRSEVYAWLGQIYAAQKRVNDARAAYQKALEIDPQNGWVRYTLLPALDKGKR